ncbi:MAG: CD1375 family protein [Gordonibacter sp.]
MAKVYARLIREGKWTLEQVPLLWREQVRQMIEQDNNKPASA